jgi:phage terminase large subunit
MDSIEESVHHTLEDQIAKLGLSGEYTVQQKRIEGPEWCAACGLRRLGNPDQACSCGEKAWRRTEFIFAGLRYNVHNVKSLEGATIVWIEEAESVSEHSWRTLLPTIRWEEKGTGRKSEVWVSFNPQLVTDATYKRWILHPPPDTWRLKTSWRDNPWFPEVLEALKEHDKATDYDSYLHIWEGECVRALAGAIYAKEYKRAVAEGRITAVPYDRSKPVHTYWDLGFGDKMAIWFAQQVGGWWQFIDYLENNGEPLSWYVIEMQRKGYVLGTCHLPHDGVDAMLHSRLSPNDRTKSPDQVLRGLGLKVEIAPKLAITTGIDATRSVFTQCRFDTDKCREGLSALEHYQWGEVAATGQERTKPLHNWASHGADALRTFGVSAKPEKRPLPPKEKPHRAPVSAWS